MDYKTRYSLGVELAKREAGIEAELQKKISAGHTRKEIYGENWQAVNINDVINRFTRGQNRLERVERWFLSAMTENTVSMLILVGDI